MGRSCTALYYHLVYSTKSHAPDLTPEIRPRLYEYIGGIVRGLDGRLLAAGGTVDHIHLLVSLHPDRALSAVLRDVKANASKWLRVTFPDQRGFAWQTGYGAFTTNRSSLEKITRYIAGQEQHHRKVSFKEEFLELLRKHGVEFDERYLWG